MQERNRLVAALGSSRLTLVILAVFAVAIGTATFIEARVGTTGARVLVYNARWFEALLALLVVNLVVSLLIHLPYSIRQIGFVTTHIGFIVVLVAAGVTRYFGYEGTMPIREGHSTDYIYTAADHVKLQVGDVEASFPVRLYKPGPTSIGRSVKLGGEEFRVSVTEYWPHFARRIVEAAGGEPALSVSASGVGHDIVVAQGDSLDASGVTVRYLADGGGIEPSASAFGYLVVELEREHRHLPVPRDPPAEITVGGYRCRIIEFAPDFRVGRPARASDPMNNPAIRVEIMPPGGGRVEKVLFAYHPDFDMGHAGGEAAELPLSLEYRYERNVYLVRDGGGVVALADFPVTVGEMVSDDTGRTVSPGERFSLAEGEVVRSGSFALMLNGVWDSALESAVSSGDENDPPAVRIRVEDGSGNSADAVAERFGEGSTVAVGEHRVRVGYGPIRVQLPYRLHLDDFVLVTYPGSENPASFESHVRVFDEEHGVDGRPVRIYMNHPLSYRGFKHFQSSYDRDRRGTVLSVNHDPGKLPTYVGYTLVGLGFLLTLTRGAWYRRGVVPR